MRTASRTSTVESHVAVVGPANVKFVLHVLRQPLEGEIVTANGYAESVSGAGVKQATASAKVASTSFIGSIGADSAGRQVARQIELAGIDGTWLESSKTLTGRAYVTVTPEGDSRVTELPGANGFLTGVRVGAALAAVRPRVVLTQLDGPASVLKACATWCAANDARLVLNASPLREIDPAILMMADPIILTEVDARVLVGDTVVSDTFLAVKLARTARSVVITIGGIGATVSDGSTARRFADTPARRSNLEETSHAFAGALASYLSEGRDLTDSTTLASDYAMQLFHPVDDA